MEFARLLVCDESVVTRSNIRYVPPSPEEAEEEAQSTSKQKNGRADQPNEEESGDMELDRHVVRAANRAAAQLFGVDERSVDCGLYPERLLPQHQTIRSGDLVVIQEAFDKLDFVYVTPGQVFHNRNGEFPHDAFVGLPFGSMVRSRNNRGYGFLYLLKPTPELWVRSLNHRTQVVHELDSAQIVHNLHLRPNMLVIESGTGSTALSHALLRTLAPHGRLHTYEYNQRRAEAAAAEFERNGVSHLVTVHHGDACEEGFPGLPSSPEGRCADAAVLDLPEPWRAVPHAARVLKIGARIATYSPCVEQTQRTVEELQAQGFHSIQTMEYRLREHYVDTVDYYPAPSAKRPRPAARDPNYWENESQEAAATRSDAEIGAVNVDSVSGKVSTFTATSAEHFLNPLHDSATGEPSAQASQPIRKLVVARPFGLMRGHTAFLTFATLGHPKMKGGKRP